MFAVAPFSPAISPAIRPPLNVATPPSLLEPTPPPPFPSPPSPSLSTEPSPPPATTSPPPAATSHPPALSPILPLPTNSAPPVKPPMAPNPTAFSSPAPESSLVPTSPPPITTNHNPNSPTPSPPTPETPPAVVPFPSPATPVSPPPPHSSRKFAPAKAASPPPPRSPRHRKVAPAPQAPTSTFTPPPTPALPKTWPLAPETALLPPPPPATVSPFTEPPLPSWPAAAPTTLPEAKVTPPPSSQSLPVAVEVQKHSDFNMSSGFIVGIVIGGLGFVFVVAVVLVLCRNSNKKKQKNHVIGAFGSVDSMDVKSIPNHHAAAAANIAFGSVNGNFTYDELVAATNCFCEANLLGEGGFGYVYKGVLRCGKEIAVKQLRTGSEQGEREFRAEVETISLVHHKNLVELVGYCVTGAERLLVYEFVPNNTLEYHLHGEGKPVVEWEKRIKIALGSAKGLAYLHEDCNPAIVHRDIKASNILLDFNFEAKVSDFGLAKIFPNANGCVTHLTTRVVGTFGYLAPEYAASGKLTDKSDVYSYGVMLLELISGRPPITAAGSRNESLVDWARPLLVQALQDGDFNNLVDPRLQKNYGADEMARMITCAAACVHHSARLRPRMSQIVGALEGQVSVSDLVGDITTTPGQTTVYSRSDGSNYDACQYQQDLRNFNLALSDSCSGYSESTSAYGLHLSASSSEVQQTSHDT